jgi:hypothetical protein
MAAEFPHVDAGGVERLQQILAAPLCRRGKPVPAGLRPGAVGLLSARSGDDGAILEWRAVTVADRFERGEDVACKLAGLVERRLDHIGGEIAVESPRRAPGRSPPHVRARSFTGNRRGRVETSRHLVDCGPNHQDPKRPTRRGRMKRRWNADLPAR